MTREKLSPRQRAVAELIAKGLDNKSIARTLGSPLGTVKHHITLTLAKTRCRNRTELAIAMLTGGVE